jgi:hypothetical protein
MSTTGITTMFAVTALLSCSFVVPVVCDHSQCWLACWPWQMCGCRPHHLTLRSGVSPPTCLHVHLLLLLLPR